MRVIIILLVSFLIGSCKSNVNTNLKLTEKQIHLQKVNTVFFSKNKSRKNNSIETKFSTRFVLNQD